MLREALRKRLEAYRIFRYSDRVDLMRRARTSPAMLIVLLLAGHAAAQEPAWKQNLRRAQLYKEGTALVQEGKWQEAADKLRDAIDIRSDPRTLLWMAYAEEQLGHLLKAKSIYERALEDAKASRSKSEEDDATAAVDAIRKKIPVLVVQVPADAPKVIVTLDAAPIEPAKDGNLIDPGDHLVRVTANGRQPFEAKVNAKEGEISVVNVALPLIIIDPYAPSDTRARRADDSATVPLLLVTGGILSVSGIILFAYGRSQEPSADTLMAVGIGTGVVGISLGTIGVIAAAVSDPDSTPKTSPDLAARPPFHVTAAPLKDGGWIGAAGRF